MILTLVVIYFIILHLYTNYCENIEICIYDSGLEGPTVTIISGSHGNESGPSYGLDELKKLLDKKEINIKKGKLILIPTLNKCGREWNIRWKPEKLLAFDFTTSDLNRNYGRMFEENGKCETTSKVQEILKNTDFIADFHEGYYFNKLNPSSMGQTLYPGKVKGSTEIATRMIDSVNKMMNEKGIKEDYKYYEIVTGWPEIDGSLRQFANIHNIPYVLTEIAGQGENQPLNDKIEQTMVLSIEMMKQIGII